MNYFLSFILSLCVFSAANAQQVVQSFMTPYDDNVTYYIACKDDGTALMQIFENDLEFETVYRNLTWYEYDWEGERLLTLMYKGEILIDWTRLNQSDLWYATVDGDNVLVTKQNFVSLN